MARAWTWIKRGFTPENLAQTLVSILVGFGVPALIRALGQLHAFRFLAHVSFPSLVALGVASAFLALALLLVTRLRPPSDEALRKAVRAAFSGLTLTVSGPADWEAKHDRPHYGYPPYHQVKLSLSTGSQTAVRRIACEVTDPDVNSLTRRFWKTDVAVHHLSPLKSAETKYPTGFHAWESDSGEPEPRFQADGRYTVEWWGIDDDDGRRLLATDSFEVRDGGLVL